MSLFDYWRYWPIWYYFKKSKYDESLLKNNIKNRNFIYGQKMINLMIKNYLKSS